MFVAPGTMPFGYKLTRDAAQDIARNWWVLLLNGALLVVAGFLIFSIDWTIRSLATFIGALFIFQGVAEALTTGIDARVRRANVVTGLLSIATGVLIIVWPSPGLLAVAIILGAWLIVMGTIAHLRGVRGPPASSPTGGCCCSLGLPRSRSACSRSPTPARRSPRSSPSAGIWAVAIGVMRIVLVVPGQAPARRGRQALGIPGRPATGRGPARRTTGGCARRELTPPTPALPPPGPRAPAVRRAPAVFTPRPPAVSRGPRRSRARSGPPLRRRRRRPPASRRRWRGCRAPR